MKRCVIYLKLKFLFELSFSCASFLVCFFLRLVLVEIFLSDCANCAFSPSISIFNAASLFFRLRISSPRAIFVFFKAAASFANSSMFLLLPRAELVAFAIVCSMVSFFLVSMAKFFFKIRSEC